MQNDNFKNNYENDYFKEAGEILRQKGYTNYVQQLIPGGVFESNEYIVKNPTRHDVTAGSFKINTSNGSWADFATSDKGGDLISLVSYIKNISSVEACFYIGVSKPSNNKAQSNLDYSEEVVSSAETTIVDNEESIPAVEDSPLIIVDDESLKSEETEVKFDISFLHKSTQKKIEGGKITLYNYDNEAGKPVGCVIRCDKEISDSKVKFFSQCSYDSISNKWLNSWKGDEKPIYNLPEIISRPDDMVMIVEGEKTAEAARLLFPEFVVTTSCMGSSCVKYSNWGVLKGRNITIAPDNDSMGSKYARTLNSILVMAKAESIRGFDSKKLGRYKIVDNKPERRADDAPVPKSYDLADALEEGWTSELIKEWQDHKDFSPLFEIVRDVQSIRELQNKDEEWLFVQGRQYKLNHKKSELWGEIVTVDGRTGDVTKQWRSISGYIKPTHCMVDENGNHGFLTKIITRQGKTVECFFSRDEVVSETDATKILLKKGLLIKNTDKKMSGALNYYLNNLEPEFQAVGVEMVGWQKNNECYVLPFIDAPRNVYVTSDKKEERAIEYILQQRTTSPRLLEQKGTLEKWKKTVGHVSRKNNLHTFSILISLTPPALKLLNEEGGFVHYVGSTSTGKSTVLQIAKSVWGHKELGSFRTTDNALESVCKNSNDGVLFLDEIGEIEADAFFKVVYMLANGVTKGRSDRNGNAKALSHFTVLAQSTGEIGLEAKLAEKKIQVKGGQLMRMAELDADQGKGLSTFDVLNVNPDTNQRFFSGREQAEYLKNHAKENCGVVIDEYLKAIVSDLEKYKELLATFKKRWIESLELKNSAVELARMAKRFSTIYATGAIASMFRIIPHSIEEIEICMNAMFKNWLDRFGGDVSFEFKALIKDLRKLCMEEQLSRFCNAKPTEFEKISTPNRKAGYWVMRPEENRFNEKGEKDIVLSEFWIDPIVFEREILKGRDKKVFYPLLAEKNYIVKDGNKFGTVKRPSGESARRFIVVPFLSLN